MGSIPVQATKSYNTMKEKIILTGEFKEIPKMSDRAANELAHKWWENEIKKYMAGSEGSDAT